MRERFFNEQMTPGMGRRERHRHVQAVWIRDEHDVRPFVERLIEIREDVEPVPGLDVVGGFDAEVRADDVSQPSDAIGEELNILTQQ